MTLSVVGLVLTLLWSLVPSASRWLINRYLAPYEAHFSAMEINPNLFPIGLSLTDVTITQHGEATLNLAKLSIGLDFLPLFIETININHVEIEGFQTHIKQLDNGWSVAGIPLPSGDQNTTAKAVTPQEINSAFPTFTLSNVMLKNIKVRMEHARGEDVFQVYEFFSQESHHHLSNWHGSFNLSAGLNNAVVNLGGGIGIMSESVNSHIMIDDITFSSADIAHFLPETTPAMDASNISLTGHTKVHYRFAGRPKLTFTAPYLSLSSEALDLQQGDQHIRWQAFTTELDDFSLALLPRDSQLTASGQTTLSLTNAALSTVNSPESNPSVRLDTLNLSSPFTLRANDKTLSLNSAKTQLTLTNGELSSPAMQTSLAALKLSLSNILLQQDASKLTLSSHVQLNTQSAQARLNQPAAQQAPISLAYDQQQLTSGLSFHKAADHHQLTLSNNDLSLDHFTLTQDNTLSGTLERLAAHNDNIKMTLGSTGLDTLTSRNNQIALHNLEANLSDGSTLVKWQSASLDSSQAEQNQNGANATIESLVIHDFVASQPEPTQQLPALTRFAALTVQDTQLHPNGVEVGQVQFDDLHAHIVLSQTKTLANLTLPKPLTAPEQEAATSQEVTPQETDRQADFYGILHHLGVSKNSTLAFEDRSISPTLQRQLKIEQLSLDNLNTRDRGAQAHVVLQATDGHFASLNSDLLIEPLADALTMQTNTTVRELELPPMSPYIASTLGYAIKAGQLNMDLNMNADNGKLDGNSHIILRQFDLGGKQDGNAALKAGAIPLNVAVGVLKDSHDNIVLDLPMKGDINNPSFQWQNFLMLPIRQGLYKASSSYLMQTFVPYANVITLVQFAGEQALKLRVQPLPFDYGEATPASTQDDFLAQLSNLMTEREDTQLKACGISVAKDISEEHRYEDLTAEEKRTLLKLANQRAENLKAYLVKQDIASGRIFICSPAIDDDQDATPHVELTF